MWDNFNPSDFCFFSSSHTNTHKNSHTWEREKLIDFPLFHLGLLGRQGCQMDKMFFFCGIFPTELSEKEWNSRFRKKNLLIGSSNRRWLFLLKFWPAYYHEGKTLPPTHMWTYRKLKIAIAWLGCVWGVGSPFFCRTFCVGKLYWLRGYVGTIRDTLHQHFLEYFTKIIIIENNFFINCFKYFLRCFNLVTNPLIWFLSSYRNTFLNSGKKSERRKCNAWQDWSNSSRLK